MAISASLVVLPAVAFEANEGIGLPVNPVLVYVIAPVWKRSLREVLVHVTRLQILLINVAVATKRRLVAASARLFLPGGVKLVPRVKVCPVIQNGPFITVAFTANWFYIYSPGMPAGGAGGLGTGKDRTRKG